MNICGASNRSKDIAKTSYILLFWVPHALHYLHLVCITKGALAAQKEQRWHSPYVYIHIEREVYSAAKRAAT